MNTVDQAKMLKDQTAQGILKSSNELKDTMRRDINVLIEEKIASNADSKSGG